MRIAFLAAGVAVVVGSGGAGASQQMMADGTGIGTCGGHADMTAQIEQHFKQTRLFAAAGEAGEIFEIYRAASGAWSIVLTPPDGPTCLIAAGATWSSLPIAVPSLLAE